jgi:PAS domain-containing protein
MPDAEKHGGLGRRFDRGTDIETAHVLRDYPLRRRDGSRAWVRDQSFPVVEDGRVRRIVGIASDISSIKATEERLHRSLEQLADAESIAGLGHCDIDLATGGMVWSGGWRRVLGLPPEVPPSYRAALRCVHPIDRPRLRAFHRGLLRAARLPGVADAGDVVFRIRGPFGERHVRESARRTVDSTHAGLTALR